MNDNFPNSKQILLKINIIVLKKAGKKKKVFPLTNIRIDTEEAREIENKLKDLANLPQLQDLKISQKLQKEVSQLKLNFRVGIEVDRGIRFKIYTDPDLKGLERGSNFFPNTKSLGLDSATEFSDLEKEISEIVILWKYLKNLILNLVNDFDVSCRLLRVLVKDTMEHHTIKLPFWLKKIVYRWFEPLNQRIC